MVTRILVASWGQQCAQTVPLYAAHAPAEALNRPTLSPGPGPRADGAFQTAKTFLLHELDSVYVDKNTTDAPDLASTDTWHQQIAFQRSTLTLEGQVAIIVNPHNERAKQIVNFSPHCHSPSKETLSHKKANHFKCFHLVLRDAYHTISSASQMTAAKLMDVIAKLPDCDGQAADAVSAHTQVKLEDAPTPKSECPDIWIRLPQHKWPKSWSNIKDPVVRLARNIYGHPLAGLYGKDNSMKFC